MTGPACLIVVKSVHHQNTAQVANAIAEVLGAECVPPEEVPYTSLDRCRLVGFGSGVYYGRMHAALFEWLRGLPDTPEATKPAFVFSTSGLPFLAKFWHAPLKKLLALKGFEVVGEFACRGFDTWGPLWLTGGLNLRHPDERDLARAREFAQRVHAAQPARRCFPYSSYSDWRGTDLLSLIVLAVGVYLDVQAHRVAADRAVFDVVLVRPG